VLTLAAKGDDRSRFCVWATKVWIPNNEVPWPFCKFGPLLEPAAGEVFAAAPIMSVGQYENLRLIEKTDIAIQSYINHYLSHMTDATQDW
jgi:hypothetical protein